MERTTQGAFATIDFAAKDFEGQSAFYERLFGWTHSDVPTAGGPYRMFSKDGSGVAGSYPIKPEMEAAGIPSMWSTYIAVDDVNATAAKAVELGGQIIMPTQDAEGYGQFAGISDPTGGAVFLWHSAMPDVSAVYGVPGALAWNDLSSREPELAVSFFEALFGWGIQAMEGGSMPYWMITVDGEPQGGIMPMPEMMPPEVPANWLVYFGAEDVRATAEKAKALGGTIVVEPTDSSGMIWAVIEDPAGAVFGLLQTANS